MKQGISFRMGLVMAVCALVVAAVAIASSPPAYIGYHSITDTITINTGQWTDSAGWEVIDSLIWTLTDTGFIHFNFSGIALLGPGDRLYLGLGNDSANRYDSASVRTLGALANPNLDTIIVDAPLDIAGAMRIPFVVQWIDSLRSQTDRTDTIYLNAALGEVGRPVFLEDVVLTATITDGP